VLAEGKVCYVGDHVALVVAETIAQAKAAANLIDVDYEILPAVSGPQQAPAEGPPVIRDGKEGQTGTVSGKKVGNSGGARWGVQGNTALNGAPAAAAAVGCRPSLALLSPPPRTIWSSSARAPGSPGAAARPPSRPEHRTTF